MAKYFDWKPQSTPFVPGKTRISYGGAMIGQEEIDAILDVVTSQGGRRWTIGPETVAFEKELAEYAQVKHAVVANSGSSALLIGISALPIPQGSSIIVPATNFPTAFNSILQAGFKPVVVDSNPLDFLIDLDAVEEEISCSSDIKAVVAVNIAGNVVDIDRLLYIREKYGVYIIIDNCDGFGSLWRGKPVESYVDMGLVSFHAAHIITTGEGGAVLTNNDSIASRATKFREWGRAAGTDDVYNYPGLPSNYRSRYVYEEIGYNLKPLELQCAMGRIQLKKIDSFRQKRKENYDKLFAIFKKHEDIFSVVEKVSEDADVCWFGFPFSVQNELRDKLMDFLESHNIETRNVFAGNIMRHPAYANLGDKVSTPGYHPGADDIMVNGMFISNHPSLTPEMIDYIEVVVNKFAQENA